MRKRLVVLLVAFAMAGSAWAQKAPDGLVWVEGGAFRNIKSKFYDRKLSANPYIGRLVTIPGFYIGKYEVTQKEWTAVMGDNPSKFKGDNLPVETVSWYDCIEYCNKRSAKEGLTPCYSIDRGRKDPNNQNDVDDIKWVVTLNPGANGYRLPTEAEWEYAAEGGQQSRNFTYPGSNDIEQVAWYWANSGDKPLTGFWSWNAVEGNHSRTHPVGSKAANELGIYDLGGNVREWCWNWFGELPRPDAGPAASKDGRVWRGGGWMGGDFCCASAWRAGFEASGKGADQGLRVCRDK